MQRRNLLELTEVSAAYQAGKSVLSDINFTVGAGEFICVLGPSGCGKSTLLGVLSGLVPPSDGSVRVDGAQLYSSVKTDVRPRLGYVFQDHRLLPWRTVRDNIAFALTAAGMPRVQHEAIIERHLEMLHVSELADAWPLNISGGQRQRVSIARALAVDPVYVLMDEPFSSLDEVTARTLRNELLRVWSLSEMTVVFVTHSVREAIFLGDRVLTMSTNPGRLYRTIEVDLPRPRTYEDPALAQIESELTGDLLREWGMTSNV